MCPWNAARPCCSGPIFWIRRARRLNVLATHPSLTVEPEALASGFEKLARTEPANALDLLPRLVARDGLTPEFKDRLRRAAALGAAYDRDPRAIAAFDDAAAGGGGRPGAGVAGPRAHCGTAITRARSTWIEQMPPSLAAQPRWRYWHARAIAATSRRCSGGAAVRRNRRTAGLLRLSRGGPPRAALQPECTALAARRRGAGHAVAIRRG